MCIKNVYYNTYGDGSQDVTERVDTCTPGEMCRRPEIREYRRKLRSSKHHVDAEEASSHAGMSKSTPYHSDIHLRLPPTPRRSKSPESSRKHKSVYINDSKVVDIHSGKKRHSHAPTRTDRDRVILHAPEPPAPRLTRSSTMPVEYTTERTSPRRSRDIPIGPANIFEELGRRRRSSSRDKEHHAPARATTYHRQHARSPSEFVYVDDEREQRERRRATRRSNTMHGRSSDFSSSAASGATEDIFTAPPPPAAPVTGKKLRWEDEVQAEIAAQNERISARPALHQDKKGILKQPKGKDAEIYEDLRRAVGRMDLLSGGKDHSSPRRSEGDEYEYDPDRLRARFGERKRRSRVMSYGTGVYGYQ